jgi:uncharacterized OsmC-like protein
MDMTTRMVLEKLQLAYRGVQVKVDLDKTDGKTEFLYHIDIEGGLSEKEKSRVKKLAENGPVHRTSSQPISFHSI